MSCGLCKSHLSILDRHCTAQTSPFFCGRFAPHSDPIPTTSTPCHSPVAAARFNNRCDGFIGPQIWQPSGLPACGRLDAVVAAAARPAIMVVDAWWAFHLLLRQ